MDLGLKDKRALVLGASTGLGFAMAQTLVREGARVAICSSNEERIRSAAANMGAALGVAADLSVAGATQSVVEKVRQAFGGLDIIVLNFGGPPAGGILEVTNAQWLESFQSLWLSAVEGIRAAAPVMKENKWGRIILVTSSSAREPIPFLSVSSGIRTGLMSITKMGATELAEHGITVNAVLPGYHATEKLKSLGVSEEAMSPQIPVKRLGRPEELAALVAFLASEQAAYITGQSIVADGGLMKGL
jgi:3-oxoacyl-[acyl-carrier protein] reductase